MQNGASGREPWIFQTSGLFVPHFFNHTVTGLLSRCRDQSFLLLLGQTAADPFQRPWELPSFSCIKTTIYHGKQQKQAQEQDGQGASEKSAKKDPEMSSGDRRNVVACHPKGCCQSQKGC